MAQTTHGIKAILSNPLVYSTLRTLMGAQSSRESFVRNYVRPFPRTKVVDIACGPADILAYFTAVKYSSFDISEDYVDQICKRALGQFHCKHLSSRRASKSSTGRGLRMPTIYGVLVMNITWNAWIEPGFQSTGVAR